MVGNLIRTSILTALGCLVFLTGGWGQAAAPAHPIATGTFIQNSLASGWDDNAWQRELAALKDVGMEYLVIGPVLDGSNEDPKSWRIELVEACLRNAKKQGFKVFVGINFDERWWKDFPPEWLVGQMQLGNKVAETVYEQFAERYKGTLFGWYWVWEIDNLRFNSPARMDMLASALNVNLDYLHKMAPGMPLMLCPFMNYRVGQPDTYQAFWEYVFARTNLAPGDIFAPQDCIGAGGVEIDQLENWFVALRKAVNTKPGLLFWSDAETFQQRFWTSAPLNRFVEQMRIVQPHVSNIISFAYSHYYSPQTVHEGFHKAYRRYVKTGKLDSPGRVRPPKTLAVEHAGAGKGLTLRWQPGPDSAKVAGYYLFRNQVLLMDIQGKVRGLPVSFTDTTTRKPAAVHYELKPYDFAGNVYPGVSTVTK